MTFNSLMEFHPGNRKNFKGLLEAYSYNRLVPFVGAGLGIPPYKTWGNALRSMCSVVPRALPELDNLLNFGDYEKAASYVFSTLQIARFTEAFREEFSPEKINTHGLSPSMELLPQIFTGLVFTTNYDRCLEASYSKMGRSFNSVYCIRDPNGYGDVTDQMMRNQPHNLFKIHGDIDNLSGRVLLETEYDELYAEEGPFEKLLSDFFRYKQFLFLGCSLTGTDRYMKILKQVAEKHTIPNYAILPTLERKNKESKSSYLARVDAWERLLSEHWILPVFYPDGEYESVTELLRSLDTTTQINKDKNAVHVTGFYGRGSLVKEAREQLKQHNYVMLYGEGGIGKTQVCEEIVSKFDGNAVKIYLQGISGYSALLQSMCNALGLNSVKNDTNDDLKKKAIIEDLRSRSANCPFLLYLDNFEDVLLQKESSISSINESGESTEDLDPSVALITEFMSENIPQFYLLISSRDVLTGFPSKRVTPLDDASMLMLFQRVFLQSGGQQEQLTQEADLVAQLIQRLSGHPLAAVLTASQVTISGSVKRILDLWNFIGNPQVKIAIDQNPTHIALETALLVSYKHIGDNQDAKLLWGYLALVSQDLLDKLVELLLPDAHFQAETCLISLSLAKRNRQDTGLSMLEPIKRQVFVYVPGMETICLRRLTEIYHSLLVECFNDQSKWRLAVELTSDILFYLNYLIDHKNKSNYEILHDIYIDGVYLNNLIINQPKTGLAFMEKLFADKVFLDSLDDGKKAELYEGRADCQQYCLLHAEAIKNYQMAYKLFNKTGNKSRAAGILYSIGDIAYWNNNYEEAKKLYFEAKKRYEETENVEGRANVLLSLGVLSHRLAVEGTAKEKNEATKQALEYYNEARKLAENSKNKHIIANIDYYCGNYYSTMPGSDSTALEFFHRALKQYQIEHDYLGCGNTYAAIGDVYYISEPKLALDNYNEAIKCYEDNEIPESYYSRITRRMDACKRELMDQKNFGIDVEQLIADVDRRIAELDKHEENNRINTTFDTKNNEPELP